MACETGMTDGTRRQYPRPSPQTSLLHSPSCEKKDDDCSVTCRDSDKRQRDHDDKGNDDADELGVETVGGCEIVHFPNRELCRKEDRSIPFLFLLLITAKRVTNPSCMVLY